MRVKRFGFVFRVKLACYEKWVLFTGKFNDLDEFFIRRDPADHKPFLFKYLAIFRIKFETVAVTFAYSFCTKIDVARQRVFLQLAFPGAKSHRTPVFFNTNEIA